MAAEKDNSKQNTNGLVIVIDDDEAVLQLITHYFKDTSIQVLCFSDAKLAADYLLGVVTLDYIKGVICDFEMPSLNGGEVLNILRSRPECLEIPFYFLTAHSSFEILPKVEGLKFTGLIKKPLSKSLLHRFFLTAKSSEKAS